MNMIQKSLILVLILISISYSQTISEYGLKMGMISSKFTIKLLHQYGGSSKIFNDRRIGPTMGIYMRYLDLRYFDLESGLYYLQKGGKQKFPITTIEQPDGTGEFATADIQFDCLQFQTGLRPYINLKEVGFYALTTGTLDYLIGVTGVTPKSDYKDIVIGYTLGVGFEFPNILNNNILIEMLFSDTQNVYRDSSIESETGSYLVRVGFSLNSPKK